MDEKLIEKIVAETVNKMQGITLSKAQKLCNAVIKKAEEIGVLAVVAVSDAAGHPICVMSMDDAYIASYDIAVNKAFTCAALKMSTKELSTLAAPGGELYGIENTNAGKIVIFGGGDVLKKGNSVLGAVGVSGGSAEEDTFLSAYGKKVFEEELWL